MKINQVDKAIVYYVFATMDGEPVYLRGNNNYWERQYGWDWSEYELSDKQLELVQQYIAEMES